MIKSTYSDGPVIIVSKDIVYAFPFGIAYLAGYLRQKGEDVRVMFRPENPRFFKSFARRLINLKPLVVGFGSLYPDLYSIREIITLLNAEGRLFPVVIGGQMISPIPDFAVKITGADCGVVGEGEIIFSNLVTALREGANVSHVKGLVIREQDTTELTGRGEFIEDLSDLPPIPYALFPTEKWLNIGKFYATVPQPHWRYSDRVISIHGGRGCPYSCNFCYHSNQARYRNIKEMFLEIEDLLCRYDANMIYFGDDLVLASPGRVEEVVGAMAKLRGKVEYSVSCRFDILSRIDDHLLREMKQSGCRIMGLGIESGSQKILDIMHKKITVKQITTGLRRLKQAGILPTVSIMVGQISETAEDIQKSMHLMLDAVHYNKLIQFAFTITTPFPGSDLYNIAKERGLLADDYDFYKRFSPSKQFGDLTVNFTELNDNEIRLQRSRLEMAFCKESRLMKGAAVMIIDSLRKIAGLLDMKFSNAIPLNLKNNSIWGILTKPYFVTYDLIQRYLDKLRLRWLGLAN